MNNDAITIARYLVENSGTTLITQERNRQSEEEGHSYQKDDQYVRDELALAAAVYAIPSSSRGIYAGNNGHSNIKRVLWPWDWEHFKPFTDHSSSNPTREIPLKERIRELTKAGALIAAEIDRLQRLYIDTLHTEDI